MTRYFSDRELERLRELRSTFLSFEVKPASEHGGGEAYWEAEEELALYDRTFARRIAWKWDAVLEELRRRGRLAGGKTFVDWGCGTGVAARAFLAASSGFERAFLHDHSAAAARFATERVRAEHPGVAAAMGLPEEAPDVLLVSHVLDELDEGGLAPLVQLAERAGAVIWVEPGSRRTSRALGEVRERLAATLDVLAPCTHQAQCGALAREGSWCHRFALAPQAVYTEGSWAELGRELGIDLRSLPYSFLALAQRGRFDLAGPQARMLARPRLTRGRAELEVCDVSGVHSLDTLQRFDKALYKQLDDVAGEPWLFDMTVEGKRIVRLERRAR
jgi:hypothetical protein